MIQSFNPPNMSDFQKRALIVGIVFTLAFLAGGAFVDPRRLFQSYLIGWTSVSYTHLTLPTNREV